MDAQTCRTKMKRLIQEETAALRELAILLEREYTHLQASAVDSLTDTMRDRHLCVGRILKMDDERRELCRSLGRPFDLKGLEALMGWCDPQGALVPDWQACTAAAARCRGLNDRNSAMAGARLQN